MEYELEVGSHPADEVLTEAISAGAWVGLTYAGWTSFAGGGLHFTALLPESASQTEDIGYAAAHSMVTG